MSQKISPIRKAVATSIYFLTHGETPNKTIQKLDKALMASYDKSNCHAHGGYWSYDLDKCLELPNKSLKVASPYDIKQANFTTYNLVSQKGTGKKKRKPKKTMKKSTKPSKKSKK
jgi:hypothetical protein